MAKQITAWRANNGTVFDDKISALENDALHALRLVSDSLEDTAIVDMIKNPHEVVAILKPLAEAIPQAEEAR